MKNKVIKLEKEGDFLWLEGDKVHLQQALINLISNGLESMVEKGPEARELCVYVSLHKSQSVKVEIRDSGIGIPKDLIKNMFQPFYTTKPGGLGMGISICHAIIEEHGGDLCCRNNPGGGATFYFILPLSKDKSSGT